MLRFVCKLQTAGAVNMHSRQLGCGVVTCAKTAKRAVFLRNVQVNHAFPMRHLSTTVSLYMAINEDGKKRLVRNLWHSVKDAKLTEVDRYESPSVKLEPSPTTKIESIAADDPKRQVAVLIDGSIVNMKAVDLYRTIRNMDVQQILSLVESSSHALDETHLALSVKRLHRLLRRTLQVDSTERDQLLADQRFQILCALLARKGRLLEPSVVADMVTFLSYFGIESTHPAMQVFLQLSLMHVNNFALDQIAAVSHIISDMTATRQTRILLDAMKVLCQARSDQLNVLTVDQKIQLLGVFGNELGYVDRLLRDLYRDRDDIHKWQQATTFFVNLGKMCATAPAVGGHFRKVRHWRLEQWCILILLRQLSYLTVEDTKELLVACRNLYIYDGELVHKIGRRAVDDDAFSFEDRLAIWSLFVDLGHFDSGLSAAILDGTKILDLSSLSMASNLSLLAVVAETVSHRQDVSEHEQCAELLESDQLLDTITRNIMDKLYSSDAGWIEPVSPDTIIDTCLYVTYLNKSCPSYLTDYLFQNVDYLLQSSSCGPRELSSTDKLKLLSACGLQSTIADSRIIESLPSTVSSSRQSSVLTAALKLAGLDNVVNDHYMPSGLHADHFVPSNESTQPSTVFFCWYHGQHFWRNTRRLQCFPLLYAKTIQRVHGHKIVVVNASVWLQLGDREKLYLITNVLTKQSEMFVIV